LKLSLSRFQGITILAPHSCNGYEWGVFYFLFQSIS
jgi:hypothetical protein